MKFLILMALVFSSTQAFAWRGRIHCKDESGRIVSSKRTDLEDFRDACQQKLLDSKACFTGERADVTSLIAGEMTDFEFFGDEFLIQEVSIFSRNDVSFVVWDQPNETVAAKILVKRCLPGFFAR